ncbi:MAG: FlgD immunoglobulin-like domain containing protein [Treponemataceae bacterium]|nr:FlgD immunoglobulin-like domain containing protein [Treponemataceae bacterium]
MKFTKKLILSLLIFCLSISFVVAQESIENNVSSRTDYISPNNDGVQDELVVPLDIKDKRYISEWSFVVTDKNGNILRTIGNKHKRADTATDVFKNLFSGEGFKGFFDNLGKTFAPKSGVEVPSEVRWNGVFDSGEIAPDGTYFYYLSAKDDNDNESRTKTYSVVVDNTPPQIDLIQPKESEKIFGAGLKPTINIKQTGSEEDLWTAKISDISGNIVRNYSWQNSSPKNISWEGENDNLSAVSEGVYIYEVTCTDKAGNTSQKAVVSNIIYDAIPRSVNLSIQGSPFSPNNDNVKDIISVFPSVQNTSGLMRTKIEILDKTGKIYRTIELDKEKFINNEISSIEYDGKDDKGYFLFDGEYQLAFSAIFNNGQEPRMSRNIIIDNLAPRASLYAESDVLSPDGDGNKDTITFVQTASSEKLWNASVVDQYGNSVKTWSFGGIPPEQISWNGIDDKGNLATDGFYYYVLSATDSAGNIGEYKTENGFELDTQKTEIILKTNDIAFSPNGDGVKDVIEFTPIIKNTSGIDRYSLSVLDSTGNVVRMWYDTKNLPASFKWNGLSDEGERCPDGNYSAILQTISKNGSEALASTQSFELDTVYPKIDSLSLPYLTFSPNEDGKKDILKVELETSLEDLWQGSIKSNKNDVVKNLAWQGKATSFDWDGSDEEGNLVKDGTYQFDISCTDKAGNKVAKKIENIVLDTRVTKAYFTADLDAFSPNGDGTKDLQKLSINATPKDGIETWKVSILDGSGKIAASWSTKDSKDLPSVINWDGKVNQEGYSIKISDVTVPVPVGAVVEGNFVAQLNLEYVKGDSVSVTTSSFVCSITPPSLTVQTAPKYFSPDNDGLDDDLYIKLKGESSVPLSSWSFEIKNPQGSGSFWKRSGTSTITERLIWDGYSNSGELVQSATDYPYVFTATDTLGMTSKVEGFIAVDVLVIRVGDVLKMQIPSIIFRADKADFVGKDKDAVHGLSADVITNNERVLQRVADILNKFRDYNVVIEGHANNLSNTEEEETATVLNGQPNIPLVPLSKDRAEYVKSRLVKYGVNESRLSTEGKGGRYPVAPSTDRNVSWKNRRVEFILQK